MSDPFVYKFFSWKKGLLHALIPTVLVLFTGVILLKTDRLGNVDDFWIGQARLSLFLFILGFWVSYLYQKGERLLAMSLCIGIFFAFLAVSLSLLLSLSL